MPAEQSLQRFFSHFFPLRPGSKLPMYPGWRDVPEADNHTENYGIALHAGEIVLDIDPRNFPCCPFHRSGEVCDCCNTGANRGRYNPWKELQDQWKLPPTRCVQTPSGGYHLYYRKPAEIKVSWHQPDYEGIDFASEGHFVVGEGSTTRDGVYRLIKDIPPAEIPLMFLISLRQPNSYAVSGDNHEDDDPKSIHKFEAYLGVAQPAVSGKHGSDTTYKTACYGRDLGLSRYAVFSLMWEKYNPRCKPPWSEAELDLLVRNAYRYAKNSQGARSPLRLVEKDEILNAVAPAEGQSETVKKIHALRFDHLANEWVTDAKHNLINNNVTNARLYLERSKEFQNMLWWDSFRQEVRLQDQPWWRDTRADALCDQDLLHIYDWLNGKMQYKAGREIVRDAVVIRAQQMSVNPLVSWLDSLEWDGVKRLDEFLINTCGARDTRWHRIAIRKFIIGCVNRAYEPGCQMDYVLVLQGDQGIRKSAWVEYLGGEWSRCGALNPDDKDMALKMLGTWIMQLDEINQAVGRKDAAAIRSFITRRSDFYRKPYAHLAEDVPRTACFIGTLNPTELGWLRDETGNRRYWPVMVHRCDVNALKKIKDQVFAEAVAYYKSGELPYFESDDDEMLARHAQYEQKEKSPWAALLKPRIEGLKSVSAEQVYALLGIPMKEINTQTRVNAYMALRDLGFVYDRQRSVWTPAEIELDTTQLEEIETDGNS